MWPNQKAIIYSAETVERRKETRKMENLYTVREVAKYLGIKEATVRMYITKKQLPAAKMGREWRILESDLKTFIERLKNK